MKELTEKATERNKERVRFLATNLASYKYDEKKTVRVAYLQCKYCFYLTAPVSGRAMTTQSCSACHEEFVHENTQRMELCKPCATTHGVCRVCCAEGEY